MGGRLVTVGGVEHLLTHDKERELCVQCHLGGNMEVMGRGVRR